MNRSTGQLALPLRVVGAVPDTTFPILSLNDFRKLTPEEKQVYLTALHNHLEDLHHATHAPAAPASKAGKKKVKRQPTKSRRPTRRQRD